jgi:hypothetical protein
MGSGFRTPIEPRGRCVYGRLDPRDSERFFDYPQNRGGPDGREMQQEGA